MSDDARERILDACAVVIARSGLRGFRMSDVARAAGVSIGLLPYHFGDREGLLQAALDRVTEGANRRAAGDESALGLAERDPAALLEAQLCSEFGDEAGVREGSTAWNELRAAAVFDSAHARAVTRSTGDWQHQISDLVGRVAKERDEELDPDHLALILTALVEGLSGRWLTGQVSAAEAQRAVRSTLHSLGLASAAPKRGD